MRVYLLQQLRLAPLSGESEYSVTFDVGVVSSLQVALKFKQHSQYRTYKTFELDSIELLDRISKEKVE